MPIKQKKQAKPKIPKGYKEMDTTYELISKTTFYKPYEPPKRKGRKSSKVVKAKEYVQPVRIVSDTSGRKKTKSKARKTKRS